MKGLIFNIQRFSLYDGPGIRATVFFKGCPLGCKWCHNPESLRSSPQLRYIDVFCIKCGRCVDICSQKVHMVSDEHSVIFERCNACGKCTQICPTEALHICGKYMEIDEICEIIMRDMHYYGQKGGVTLSGGEPLLQAGFAFKLAKRLKEECLHVALDTCGYCNRSEFEMILPYIDLVLFDVKHIDSAQHKMMTGTGNEMILENLKMIAETGKDVTVRIPIIPSFNDDEKNLYETAAMLKECGIKKPEVLPYHVYGVSKYAEIGEKYTMDTLSPPTKEKMESIEAHFINRRLNINVIV